MQVRSQDVNTHNVFLNSQELFERLINTPTEAYDIPMMLVEFPL